MNAIWEFYLCPDGDEIAIRCINSYKLKLVSEVLPFPAACQHGKVHGQRILVATHQKIAMSYLLAKYKDISSGLTFSSSRTTRVFLKSL